jgi:uncharacterized membrane protein YfcA
MNAAALPVLLGLLGLVTAWFSCVWVARLANQHASNRPSAYQCVVGFVTDFLDTLGIGSFAVTAALYRPFRTVADEHLPGTLNVGHTLPTIAQAFIYVAMIDIDLTTLVSTIAAAVLGAWLGAGVVTRLSRQRIQIGMGLALLVAAVILLERLLRGDPAGGTALGLSGGPLAIALASNFVFGALMMIGVGAYAPIMILVSLLGMNPVTAFPIMMGSCAFLMPAASVRFIRTDRYDARAALGLTLGGIPGVLIAAFIVQSLPLDAVKWLVLFVVLFTSASMLWSAAAKPKTFATDQVRQS